MPRPPATGARRLLPWLAELASVPGGLVEAYVPGRGITARTREQVIVAVSEANGCRTSAWVHGAWLDYLGRREPEEVLQPLFDYARACAEAGRPVDATVLSAMFPPAVVRTIRATVARAEVGNAAGAAVDAVVERGFGRAVLEPGTARAVAGAAIAAPWVVPAAVAAATMRAAARLAPVLPPVAIDDRDDANLVAHLLAEAAPTYLGHAGVRAGLAVSPVTVAVAFRVEGSAATIRLGRGRVEVTNGVTPDALLVVDGGVEPLLSTVATSILRDLGVPLRRGR